MLNKNMLVSKMKLHGDNNADIAEYIGISQNRFSAKLNGADFSQSEILKIIQKYNLTPEEVMQIFFCG